MNIAPILSTSLSITVFSEAQDLPSTAVVIDSAITVIDSDNLTLPSAIVSISNNYVHGEDVLLFRNDETGAMGNIVAYFDSNTGALSLQSANNSATLTQWEAALHAVKYLNTSDTPNTHNRTISFSVNDGGLDSNVASKTVSVTASNDSPTFKLGDGKVTTDFGSNWDYGNSVTVQADGKILVAGVSYNGSNSDFALTRYNVDGSLDLSFDGDGKVTTDFGSNYDSGNSVTVQADGKILVAGVSYNGSNEDFALTRYNVDGSLDTSFDGDGKVTTDFGSNYDSGNSVTVQADGKILVAGVSYNGSNEDFALTRYNVDGSLDTSFDGDGKVTTDFGSNWDYGNSVTVQADGKILVAGVSWNGGNDDFALTRYNVDGSLDLSFDGDGKVTTDFGSNWDYGNSVTVQADGKILVAGVSWNGGNDDFALTRYNVDGSLDLSFDGDGKVTTDFGSNWDYGNSVTVQADGKILVAGVSYNGSNAYFALTRYNVDGSLDLSFDGDGKVTTDFGSNYDVGNSVTVTVQTDGKIVVAGTKYFLDNYSNPISSEFALARYNPDGTLDTSFNPQDTLGGTASFTKGGAAVVLDNNVTVSDAELNASNYNGATLTLARHGGVNAQDVFSSSDFSHRNVIVLGTTIGTFSQQHGELTITFNTDATQTLVNSALQTIAYSNRPHHNPPTSVQIDWTFDDGHALTTTSSTTVTIERPTPNNDILNGTEKNNNINALAGDDIVYGNGGNDKLTGGEGQDLLVGGTGKDKYDLKEQTAATDTIKIATGDSLTNGFDEVRKFALGTGNTTTGVDKLDLDSTLIAADIASVDGINVGVIHSHSISNGIITFDNADLFGTAFNVRPHSLTNIVNYLQSNISGNNTVAFNYHYDTYVFQDSGANPDTLVKLVGVIADNLSTSGLEAGSIWLV